MELKNLNGQKISKQELVDILNKDFEKHGAVLGESTSLILSDADKGLIYLPVGVQGFENEESAGEDQKITYDLGAGTVLDPVFYATGKIFDLDGGLDGEIDHNNFYAIGGNDKRFPVLYTNKNDVDSIDEKVVGDVLDIHADKFASQYEKVLSAFKTPIYGIGQGGNEITINDINSKGKLIDARDALSDYKAKPGTDPLVSKVHGLVDNVLNANNARRYQTAKQALVSEISFLNSMYNKK